MNIRLLFQLFRIASVMCYIGHGVFGFITKQIWCNYFAVFGIGESLAYQLMPWVGFVDVALGVLLLVYPLRIAAGWLVFWGIFTALLRPLAGEPFAEFIERAGNFGAPFILLLLSTPATGWRDWFRKLEPVSTLDERRSNFIVWSARVFGFLLLAGHGWLNLLEKKGLIDQYISLGIANPEGMARTVGIAEVIGAFVVLAVPIRQVLMILFVWKMASELFYPAWPFFEWVERGGSYAMLLGLWFMVRREDTRQLATA